MTRAHAIWVIYASLAAALLFTLLPLPIDWRGFRPDVAALALFYWVLALPHRVGVATAFTVGVTQDLIEGAPLGLSSPGLMLATLLLLYNYQRIRQFDLLQQSLAILIFLLLSGGIEQWLRNGSDVPLVPWAGGLRRICPCFGAHSHSTSSLQTLLRGVLMRLLLASSSPRRRALLSLLVSDFESLAPDIDERPRTLELPADYVARLASEKAKTFAADQWVILGSDTTVAIGHDILGKPRDSQDAAAILRALSGNTHEVHTAVALAYGGGIETVTCTTSVMFTELTDTAIQQYLLTDEPWDKAGAYAIQGYAGAFVSQIKGSYSAVVGLPLCETRALLIEAGVPVRHG